MRCVIGYEATPQGIDAINLGIDLARTMKLDLDIVLVLRRHDVFNHEYPPTGTANDILLAQAFRWVRGALDQIPSDITVRGHVYSGISSAEGLTRAAEELNAALIVVGGASSSPFKRHRLGTIAHELLYGSHYPVALAPRGYLSHDIDRVNCAVGTRPGAGSLVDMGVTLACRAELPLRLIALVSEADGQSSQTDAIDNARSVLDSVTHGSPPPKLDIEVSATNLSSVQWHRGDVMFVGSSRVAEKHTVFAGSVAMHLLRTLTVPLVVVPRDYRMKAVD